MAFRRQWNEPSLPAVVAPVGAIVCSVLGQLYSIIDRETQQEVRLVEGVEKEVETLGNNLQAINTVLVDAEDVIALVGILKRRNVRVWLDKIKVTCYDLEDVLDKWSTAMLKMQIEGAHQNALIPMKEKVRFIALKLKEICVQLDVINKEKKYRLSNRGGVGKLEFVSSSFVDVSEICARDNEKKSLVRKLCESGERIRSSQVISIVGIRGAGKTTLAQFTYNDNMVKKYFDARVWVDAFDSFDELGIAKSIIKALKGVVVNVVEFRSLLQWISQSVVGRKCLLVLDNVSIEDYEKWKPFYRCLMNGLPGSKILITTCNETVAHMIKSDYIIPVKELLEEECWKVFNRLAFFNRSLEDCENLEEIGRKIIRKCNGLPFAAKLVGSLLRFKTTVEQWQIIFYSVAINVHRFEDHHFPFEDHHFPFLFLSYNSLPRMIKRCLLYCAIFPKNYNINKDRLIKLWMAQGYLGLENYEEREIKGQEYFGLENYEEMEIKGQEYFDCLVNLSFFDVFKKDHDGSILYYKMHDIIYDFVQFLSKFECLSLEVSGREDPFTNFPHEKVQHLMLMVGVGASVPSSICNVKKLRSLIIQHKLTDPTSFINVLPNLFDQLTVLRALDLSGKRWYANLVKEIPGEIEKLMYLRYLNLSSLKIKELPETLCELFLLQTLELNWCTYLKKLPEGIGKLINLRHIVNNGTSLDYMPKGIERLTCLRTLSEFFVGDYTNSCTLKCLKNLSHLRGSLCIKRLGNIEDIDEAKEAELEKKNKLLFLHLDFENDVEERRVSGEEEEKRMNKDKEILEALQPPPVIQRLEIRGYKGYDISVFWIWPLTKLRVLNLYDWVNVEDLRPLGELSSLESLSIWSMRSVKRVGFEFLGARRRYESSVFPKLISLKFVNMEEWEEWIVWEDFTIMPRLRFLSFEYCPKLKKLPEKILQETTLEELSINWCPILKERYSQLTGEDWHKISHIPNVMINFEYVQRDSH